MLDTLDRIDGFIYRVERFAVAAMLAIMGVVVFLDVVYRVSATTDSPLIPDTLEQSLGSAAAPVWAALALAVVATLAFQTRGDSAPVAKGVGVGALCGVLLFGYVTLLPNGMLWSQTLALSLTLWMGMTGACIAAYQRRHLALDVGSKLWPASIAPKVSALGHFVTAAFCALVVVLGLMSVFGTGAGETRIQGHIDSWLDSEFSGGNMTGTFIPKWLVMISIPVGMVVLAFRFTLQGVKTWTGREALAGDDTLRLLGLEDEVQS
jgi:TRAP-type C4-dicarboxylate transport system permease small subunit